MIKVVGRGYSLLDLSIDTRIWYRVGIEGLVSEYEYSVWYRIAHLYY